jgi:hypothetical protein
MDVPAKDPRQKERETPNPEERLQVPACRALPELPRMLRKPGLLAGKSGSSGVQTWRFL